MVMGASLAMAVTDESDVLAGVFFSGGLLLVLVHAFGDRLLRATLALGASGRLEFDLGGEAVAEPPAAEGPSDHVCAGSRTNGSEADDILDVGR
jgi:hypothetical protein